MDRKQQTIDTYNATAERMAEKFTDLGSYADIADVFALIRKESPAVLEIGCGNGRDAIEILKYTKNYVGIDIAEKFIEIARRNVPQAIFEVGDIESYVFPHGLDIIFAFASLIHVPKESLARVLNRAYGSLSPGGVMRLSLKYSDEYKEVVREDAFGVRTYYHYSLSDIEGMAGRFSILRNKPYDLRDQKWIEVLLQKDPDAAI